VADERGSGQNSLFYLATPPTTFPMIVERLGQHGLAAEEDGWRRVVIEKPFGRDLQTSEELNQVVHQAFDERQVLRIDHYLGKETVQNILVLRFANGIFEPVWNRNFIDHVQITVAESIGVEGRGRFYEEAGALRDIVQNHMLQVLSFVAMEPPASFGPEAVRDERAKVLKSVRPLDATDVVRGQYTVGFVDGERVPAYVEEDGVSPASEVETYLAARASIDNWRWADTPFYLRTGKRLPKRVSEVAITFKRVPHLPFSYAAAEQLEPNVLVMRIQPDEGISLRFGAKVPAARTQIRTVTMDFQYGTTFAVPPAEAYETLLLDAMRGDTTNFTRTDSVEESWRIVEPVLDLWRSAGGAPHLYAAGSWGPDAADEMLARDGRRWRKP
jgi:glucose-6-phosphate 1-dehydrogenase